MLAQANDEIPELKAINDELFDLLGKVRTRGAMELLAKGYKRDLADLRNRGIISKQQYDKLRSVIPMRIEYAWAKKTKEIGTPEEVRRGEAKMTPVVWAKKKGYFDKTFLEILATGAPLLYAAGYYPIALVETAKERIEDIERILPEVPKILKPKEWPWWAWALIAAGGLAAGVYVLRSVTAAVREARAITE